MTLSPVGPSLPSGLDPTRSVSEFGASTDVAVGAKAAAGKETLLAERNLPPLGENNVRFLGVAYLGSKAVAGISVSASKVDAEPTATPAMVSTKEDGSFAIDVPAMGDASWLLTFDGPGVFPEQLFLGKVQREETNLGRVRLEAGTPVSGRLLGLNGEPVAGAWIQASEGEEYSLVGCTGRVDPDGSFVLPKVPRGGRILAGAPGHRLTRSSLARVESQRREDPNGLPTLHLYDGLPLAVSVMDQARDPLQGALVQLLPYEGLSGRSPDWLSFESAAKMPEVLGALTDASGVAHFDNLEDVDYFARAQRAGYLPGLGLHIQQDLTQAHVLTLERAPELWLSIVADDPETGATFVPEGLRLGLLCQSERLWLEVEVPRDGLVRKILPNREPWTFEVWAPGHTLQMSPVLSRIAKDAPPQTVKLLDVRTDTLRITDTSGTPLADAELSGNIASAARRQLGIGSAAPWPMQALRLGPGTFALPRPGDSEAPTWTAKAAGRLPATWTRVKWPARASADEETLEQRLDAAARLWIQVEDEEGVPVPNASVYLTVAGKGSAIPARTREDGGVWLEELAPGRVSLKARGPAGRISKAVEVELTSGGTHEARLVL